MMIITEVEIEIKLYNDGGKKPLSLLISETNNELNKQLDMKRINIENISLKEYIRKKNTLTLKYFIESEKK